MSQSIKESKRNDINIVESNLLNMGKEYRGDLLMGLREFIDKHITYTYEE